MTNRTAMTYAQMQTCLSSVTGWDSCMIYTSSYSFFLFFLFLTAVEPGIPVF